jgi:hypothetical protein
MKMWVMAFLKIAQSVCDPDKSENSNRLSQDIDVPGGVLTYWKDLEGNSSNCRSFVSREDFIRVWCNVEYLFVAADA